ncbi:ankyrin repeat domain-containing protein [Sphingomonas sp. 1P08PE]|uniref:ankyrin repeat domain-containing protein n=1 Tax=Sphingomonas sp. 1P08PE TaxID=554122 RepID=UPI0039A3084D
MTRKFHTRRGHQRFTPLMIVSALGRAQAVALLLTAGADVLAVEPRMGATALHKAAQSGSADVLGLLLDHGAFVDQQSPVLGNTAIMDALLHKHADAVRLLLSRRARTSIRTTGSKARSTWRGRTAWRRSSR